MQIKSKEPVLADALYKSLGAWEAVQSVHESIRSEHIHSWNYGTIDEDHLDGLLAHSHRALFYVEENGLNRVAKKLFELGNVVTAPPYRPPGPLPIISAMREFLEFVQYVLNKYVLSCSDQFHRTGIQI
jgi:hypothetical protein